jgi:hypothetical protein
VYLTYDFRLSDLRLDYLVEKGFDILIAYAGIPDFLSESGGVKTSVSKNKTRYKGKMWNTAPPKDYGLWEEICYEYTKHIVQRYGIETVSKWRLHCFNEPDIPPFFRGDLGHSEEDYLTRCREYCMLYSGFERAVRRVSEQIRIGGPALANVKIFFEGFLKYVKENNLKLDYIALHNYGTSPLKVNRGDRLAVESIINTHMEYLDIVKANGFENTEIVIDEHAYAVVAARQLDRVKAELRLIIFKFDPRLRAVAVKRRTVIGFCVKKCDFHHRIFFEETF